MRRSRTPLRLRESPLVLALAQVRTSPVLKMDQYVPSIQEELRRVGFPLYSESVVRELVVAQNPSTQPSMVTQKKWLFLDKTKETAIVVAPDFVAMQTVAYDTFDAFSERFSSVLTTFGSVVQPELAQRVGLRYVDHVRPGGDDRIEDYFSSGLAGLDATDIGVGQSTYVAQGDTDLGHFVFRLTRGRGSSSLPPDLQPPDLDVKASSEDGEFAMLDVDNYLVATREYDPSALVDVMWDLHDVVDGLFRSAITPHALERWGAEEVDAEG